MIPWRLLPWPWQRPDLAAHPYRTAAVRSRVAPLALFDAGDFDLPPSAAAPTWRDRWPLAADFGRGCAAAFAGLALVALLLTPREASR